MAINSRTVGSLRYMKNHLVVWGEKWCPPKNACRSSAGKQGQLLADGTYASEPEPPSESPTELTDSPVPPSSPSPYLHPPSLEDDELMFELPRKKTLRSHGSEALRSKRLRRVGRRQKGLSSVRARRLSPDRHQACSSPSRYVRETPAMESNILLRSHEALGVAAPCDLTPSHNEPNRNLLAPLELDTHLKSFFAFPSQEAYVNGTYFNQQLPEPSKRYVPSSHDNFASAISATNGSSELMGAAPGRLLPVSHSFTDVPYGYGCIEQQQSLPASSLDWTGPESTPFPLTSHYERTTPFMPFDGMYPLRDNMLFSGSYPISAGEGYIPTAPLAHVPVPHISSGGDGHFLSTPARHAYPSPPEQQVKYSFADPASSAPGVMAPNPFPCISPTW